VGLLTGQVQNTAENAVVLFTEKEMLHRNFFAPETGSFI
jgi:hypothetical protein